MRFTFWAVGAPLLLALVSLLFAIDRSTMPIAGLLGMIWLPWVWVGSPATVVYWVVRLVRHAWRDGSSPKPARPTGWIYPEQ